MISPHRFQRVDAIFDAPLKLPPHERDGYVLLACAGDAELREEVGALLRSAATAESALGESVAEFAALLIENIASESGSDQSLDPDAGWAPAA